MVSVVFVVAAAAAAVAAGEPTEAMSDASCEGTKKRQWRGSDGGGDGANCQQGRGSMRRGVAHATLPSGLF
jgi:hypothetical protein